MLNAKSTFCRICEPHCSMIADLDSDGKIERLRPDRGHPGGGAACHKGLSFLEVHYDPDRLDWPLKKAHPRSAVSDEFVRTSWDAALAEIGEKLIAIREKYGANAIGIYSGNPFALANSTAVASLDAFRQAIGTELIFGSNTQDASNKLACANAVYGSIASTMTPDLYHTQYLLCLGSNPRVSRWTVMSVPNDDLLVLKKLRQRGGEVRFVNPRITESSTDETGPTILINPGADVYFLAALLNEVEKQRGFDETAVDAYGKNIEGLRNFVRRFPAEAVQKVTGISSEVIKQTARELIGAESAAVYMATGVNQSRQGMLCYWLVEMLNFVTGNLGKKGGSYKPAGFIEHFPPGANVMSVNTSLGTFELPDPIGHNALPAALMPELIKNGDIRALLIFGGNPVLTVGGEEKMREACSQLELMVSVDIFRQATCELSDYILPSTDWLEHMDVNFILSGVQTVPYVQYTDVIEAPAEERRNGWWILAKLLQSMKLPSPLDDDPNADDAHALVNGLLASRGLSVETMRTLPSNTFLLEQEERDALFAKCLRHPDRKIDCCPASFEEKGLFKRCCDIFEELAAEPPGALKLISLRTRYMHNSWLVNATKFRRGRNAVNPLNMTEVDAAARGLHDGDRVRVFNRHGSIETEILITNDLKSGVVAMTHGYGHDKSYGLTKAHRKPGANCNALMPIGLEDVEPISYMSWMSGVPVEVEKLVH